MNNIDYTLSTMGIEELVLSQTAINYAVKVEQGKMLLEEAVEAIRRMYKGDNKK